MDILSITEKLTNEITKIGVIHLSMDETTIIDSESMYFEINRMSIQKLLNSSKVSQNWISNFKFEIIQQVFKVLKNFFMLINSLINFIQFIDLFVSQCNYW